MRKGFLSLLLVAMLNSSACVAPMPTATGPWRTVEEAPTSPYATVNVDYAPFDISRALIGCNVIFRGTYQGGRDVRISWETRSGTTADAYLSVLEITVLDVLYGSLPSEDTLHAVSNASWETGDLDIRLQPGGEYYFLGHVFTDEDRRLPLENPDNQLRIFELGDVHISRIVFDTMPVSNGVVRYWNQWPLEGITLPTEQPASLSQGVTTMPQQEFERKLLALVRQMQGQIP